MNGSARVCYDVLLEDGVERRRTQSSRTILKQPINQVVAVGVDLSRLEPIAINGSIFYISNGQARLIRETSLNQVTLPTGGNLDGFVFALSPDGRRLLYTRKPDAPSLEVFNELWVLMDTSDPNAQPVKLIVDNVFYAEWLPDRPNAFSYSTLRPRTEPPAYQALNDLFIAQLDAAGKIVNAQPLLPPTDSGTYSQWGDALRMVGGWEAPRLGAGGRDRLGRSGARRAAQADRLPHLPDHPCARLAVAAESGVVSRRHNSGCFSAWRAAGR